LVPRQHSSGGKDRLGSISKQGHRYLRQMLVVGALAVIRYCMVGRLTASQIASASAASFFWRLT
jgi:transposase